MNSDIEQYRWVIAELRRRGLPEDVIAAVREDVAEHIRGKLRAAIKRRYHLSQRQKRRLRSTRSAGAFRAFRNRLIRQVCVRRRQPRRLRLRRTIRRCQHRQCARRAAPVKDGGASPDRNLVRRLSKNCAARATTPAAALSVSGSGKRDHVDGVQIGLFWALRQPRRRRAPGFAERVMSARSIELPSIAPDHDWFRERPSRQYRLRPAVGGLVAVRRVAGDKFLRIRVTAIPRGDFYDDPEALAEASWWRAAYGGAWTGTNLERAMRAAQRRRI